MPEALFNIARYLYHELLKDEPKGKFLMNRTPVLSITGSASARRWGSDGSNLGLITKDVKIVPNAAMSDDLNWRYSLQFTVITLRQM